MIFFDKTYIDFVLEQFTVVSIKLIHMVNHLGKHLSELVKVNYHHLQVEYLNYFFLHYKFFHIKHLENPFL